MFILKMNLECIMDLRSVLEIHPANRILNRSRSLVLAVSKVIVGCILNELQIGQVEHLQYIGL